MPNSDKVVVLDLATAEIRHQRPDKILQRRDYNRQDHVPEGGDEFIFEKALATIFESQLPGILDKLQAGGTGLIDKEILLFMEFLEIQRLNVPRTAKVFMGIAKRQVEEIAHSIPEVSEGMKKYGLEVKIKDCFRFNYMRELIGSREFVKYLYRMVWYLRKMPADVPLVTTDAPVVIINSADKPGALHGIGLLGSTLIYPLSPSFYLEMIHPERIGASPADYLRPLDAVPITEEGITLRRYDAPISKDESAALNRVLVTQADRYVVSSSQDIIGEILDEIRTMS